MNIKFLLDSTFAIKIHTLSAFIAILVGGFQFIAPKGNKLHKILGNVWIFLMLATSISSFWIKGLIHNNFFFGYSPIHLLSILVITQIIAAYYYAKTNQIIKHKKTMIGVYFFGLILAGVFTFVPGRILYKVFF